MKITPTVINRMNEARSVVATMHVDDITVQVSAFRSFRDLVEDSLRTGYRPTMRLAPVRRTREEFLRAAMTEILADAYDKAMARSGSDIRAYRGSMPSVPNTPTAWTHVMSA
jgi:hypothetical protein